MFYDKISSRMDNNFIDWLLVEMSKREWSQAELARASGLTRQSVSDYINRRRTNPEPDALTAIAHALKISPITIFRKAGLLPAEDSEQVKIENWKYLLTQLTPDEQDEIKQFAEMKIDRRQKAEQAARAKNFKPKTAG
jgi:transcriptional regulator with XRE-family HTH domain